jgi:hypothetical protein
MKRLLLAACLLPASLALAAEERAPPSEDPMAGWVPSKLANPAKDRKEIQALLQAMDAAGKRGDIDAAAALVDFPVVMATDDSKGEGMAESWSREEWMEVMRPFYAKPLTDVKVTHKPDIFLLSDSLASVDDVATVKTRDRTITMRNTTLLVRRDGKWMVKMMAEPGWGDMPQMHGTAPPSPEPSSQGTGAGAQQPSPAPGMGSGGREPPPERTTK